MADQPGYTRIPNALLELLPTLPDAECRILLAILRKTAGWQKECDVISNSQLETATGMSRQGVINGVASAMKRGILKREKSGHNNGFCYQVVNEIDHLNKQSTKQTSQPNVPLVVNEIDHLEAQVVNEVDTQKKDLKQRKESVRSAHTKRPPTQSNLDTLHEAVKLYKQLTGSRPPPTTETLIASTVIDYSAWEVAIKAWCGRGFKPSNAEGMIDWYLHPEKQQQRGTTNGNSKPLRPSLNGHSERGKLREADLDHDF